MRFRSYTQRRTTVGRTSLDEGPARHRDLYLTTNTTLTTDKRPCPGGIRTHDPSRRTAVDLRPRQHGRWDGRVATTYTKYAMNSLRKLLRHL